jgi:hypothetical protein
LEENFSLIAFAARFFPAGGTPTPIQTSDSPEVHQAQKKDQNEYGNIDKTCPSQKVVSNRPGSYKNDFHIKNNKKDGDKIKGYRLSQFRRPGWEYARFLRLVLNGTSGFSARYCGEKKEKSDHKKSHTYINSQRNKILGGRRTSCQCSGRNFSNFFRKRHAKPTDKKQSKNKQFT